MYLYSNISFIFFLHFKFNLNRHKVIWFQAYKVFFLRQFVWRRCNGYHQKYDRV